MTRRHVLLPAALLSALLIAGCADEGSSTGDSADPAPPASSETPSGTSPGEPPSSAAPTTATSAEPVSTPGLDGIAVMGHSGATGYNSDPANPTDDVVANSWATGTNPKVMSIYQRLLATHPALADHVTNTAIDGSTVDSLVTQTDDLLQASPLPDVVIIQSIDNDIRCDGTDAQNYAPFAATLDGVLTTIENADPGVQFFFEDQIADAAEYTRTIAGIPDLVAANYGTGPCDLFTTDGKVRPRAIKENQKQVNAYFARITEVCARHQRCFTDKGALQDVDLVAADISGDGNHLTVAGHAKEAAAAWQALPKAIKNRR